MTTQLTTSFVRVTGSECVDSVDSEKERNLAKG